MRSQADVGMALWPAAAVLGRWIVGHQAWFEGRRVLEIGAGMGLSGLVAALFARETVLSDFNREVLRNLRGNVALNLEVVPNAMRVAHLDWDTLGGESGAGGSPGEAAGCGPEPEVPARPLDSLNDSLEDRGSFDIVIGSDMVCHDSDGAGTARVLRAFLRRSRSAVGVFLLAPPETRWGVAAFRGHLEAAGFNVAQATIDPVFVGADESEGTERPVAASPAEGPLGERDPLTATRTRDFAVAGGYEARLQLFLATWGETG